MFSSYRVLPHWVDGRKGLPYTDDLKSELRDVAARIHELILWFAEADLVLEATLADTIPRTGLGFPPAVPDEVGMWTMTDLFGNGQISLFGEAENLIPHPKLAEFVPDIPRIRGRLHAALEAARAAPATPWPDKERQMWQTVFPNMSKWLPDDEREQPCFEFAAEIERLLAA